MSPSITYSLLFFLLTLINLTSSSPSNRSNYVRNACSVTHYQDLCVRTLTPFSSVAKNSPSKWTRASVSVAITDNKDVLRYLLKIMHLSTLRKRDRVALSDCRELLQDSLDNLHKSLSVLRTLKASQFQEQMSDLATWLSSSLTDKDTCIDGFEKSSAKSSTVRMIRRRVTTSMYLSSNSLALLNKLAANGL